LKKVGKKKIKWKVGAASTTNMRQEDAGVNSQSIGGFA